MGGALEPLDDVVLPQSSRPEPNGIQGWLLTYAVVSMVVLPLLTFWLLYRFMDYAYNAPRKTAVAVMVFIGVSGLLALVSGYRIYSGHPSGRRTANVFLLCAVLLIEILPIIFGFQNAPLLMLVPAGILYAFTKSPLSRNNYNAQYSHIPIRPPLAVWERRAWLAWGSIVIVALVALTVRNLTMPDPLKQAGIEPVAEGQPPIPLPGTTIAVPVPASAKFLMRTPMSADGVTYFLHFIDIIARGEAGTVFTIGYYDGEYDMEYDVDIFAEIKEAIRNDPANAQFVVESETDRCIVVDHGGYLAGEPTQLKKTTEAYLIMDGKLVRLRVIYAMSAPVIQVDTVSLAMEWLRQISAANGDLDLVE